jgi:hypothetical protein
MLPDKYCVAIERGMVHALLPDSDRTLGLTSLLPKRHFVRRLANLFFDVS